jgi:steroid delta-isomerase-like uncharacterized protein
MPVDNEAIVRRFFEEAWNKGNVQVVEELCTDDHVLDDPSNPGAKPGHDTAKQVVTSFRQAFPDASLTIEDQFSAGNKVTTRWTARGTHRGPLQSMSATGKQVVVKGIQVDEVVGGKVVRTWVNWDSMGLMQQLSAASAP